MLTRVVRTHPQQRETRRPWRPDLQPRSGVRGTRRLPGRPLRRDHRTPRARVRRCDRCARDRDRASTGDRRSGIPRPPRRRGPSPVPGGRRRRRCATGRDSRATGSAPVPVGVAPERRRTPKQDRETTRVREVGLAHIGLVPLDGVRRSSRSRPARLPPNPSMTARRSPRPAHPLARARPRREGWACCCVGRSGGRGRWATSPSNSTGGAPQRRRRCRMTSTQRHRQSLLVESTSRHCPAERSRASVGAARVRSTSRRGRVPHSPSDEEDPSTQAFGAPSSPRSSHRLPAGS